MTEGGEISLTIDNPPRFKEGVLSADEEQWVGGRRLQGRGRLCTKASPSRLSCPPTTRRH